MTNKIKLNEEDDSFQQIKKDWEEGARSCKWEDLPAFLNSLMEDYQHDYGTIVHAITTGAVATAWAMNHHEQGGITGFQASFVKWGFLRQWEHSNNKCGLKLIDYDNMLYPQHEDMFDKTISQHTWEQLQKEAQAKIDEHEQEKKQYAIDLVQYERELADFADRFPDYENNPDKYTRIDMGTSEEWMEQDKKEEAGFEFAPSKPYEPLVSDRVARHWQSIVDGKIPFGYRVTEDD